jgi:hypothetical protein
VYKTEALSDAAIENVATEYCRRARIIGKPGETCTVPTPTRWTDANGNLLSVTVNYNYYYAVIGHLVNLFPGDPFPNPLLLSATTTMYMEN